MKIISKTKDGYLVDFTSNELGHLIENDSSLYRHRNQDLLGKEFNLSKIWQHARYTHRCLDEITSIQIRLRSIADEIEPVKTIAGKIKESSDENRKGVE